MSNESPLVLFEQLSEKSWLKIVTFLLGFFLGWLGTHYVVALFYPITGPICIFGLHFHHLYIGLIILVSGLVGYFLTEYKLWFWFILAFGIGMVLDDVLDHWILLLDPFEFWCS
jgi:hypothetical protein